jgi:uncharacterized protein YndB with AHSA1/START domain
MDPVTNSVVIDRPQEEVFEYLADVANHLEFSDHYVTDFRVTREDTYGAGAGARFRLKLRGNRFAFADLTFIDFERPKRIVMAGRGGKYNRTRILSDLILEPAHGGGTRVTLTTETQPGILSDRLTETIYFQRGWLKRSQRKALRRLGSILEEGKGRGMRATIATGARKPASRFRYN